MRTLLYMQEQLAKCVKELTPKTFKYLICVQDLIASQDTLQLPLEPGMNSGDGERVKGDGNQV